MAQTGYTPILIYSSSTASNAPAVNNLTNSTLGSELAINITDGKLFYKDNANAIQVIGWKTTPTTAGGTGLTSYTAGDMLYYASGTALSKLGIGASGTYMSSSGAAPQWTAPAALTKTDDTNVTLTLGGSASTALLNAASLTLGWTGTLAVGRGGTGNSSFTTGDLLYASASTTLSKLGIGAADTVLTSSGSAPQWSTSLTLSGSVTASSFVFTNSTGSRPGSSGQYIVDAANGGFYQFTGSYYLVTTSGGSTSDATLKTNVQQLTGALDKVCAIRGVNFEFIEQPLSTPDQGRQVGVVAQEVEAQYPEIVVTDEKGIKSVRYDRLVAPLIEAIKELKTQLDLVKAELAQVKAN